MQTNMIPFNLDLLVITDQSAKLMLPINALDIMEGSSRNFHPEGLFSTEIFGKIGEDRRSSTFSYINLKVSILHPLVFELVSKLKALYLDIMLSKSYAIWDKEKKDFEKATPTTGETGYSFFMKYFDEIKYVETNSPRREFSIKLLHKYSDKTRLSKLLVMPAGLRDFEYDETGKPSEDEINGFYRKILNLANLVDTTSKEYNSPVYDSVRASLQVAVMDLYDYIKGLLEGKHKLVLGKWASRRIQNSTSNVISSLNNDTDELNSPLTVGCNETVVGLFQYLKTSIPISIYNLRSGFLQQVFSGPNSPASLVDKKTLKKKLVHVSSDSFDEWMTSEGLEKVIDRYGETDLRHSFLEIEDCYLGLIYKGPGVFKLFQDIDDLPAGLDKKDVFPITFTELLYIAVSARSKELHGFITRYPITGYGSIYPSKLYLKTTVPSEIRTELTEDWNKSDYVYNQFPVINAQFMDSMSPSPSHLKRMGADFDGDKCSLNAVFSDEAQDEIKKLLKSRSYYVSINNEVNFSAETDTLEYTLSSMTA